jgi:hypothetical protein
LKADNINVDSIRKISECKINALKVERVQNTFENLYSSETTLKMLKTMQIYQNAFFWGFPLFFAIFDFSINLSETWVKNWVATHLKWAAPMVKREELPGLLGLRARGSRISKA